MQKLYKRHFVLVLLDVAALLIFHLLCDVNSCCADDDFSDTPSFISGYVASIDENNLIVDKISKGALQQSLVYGIFFDAGFFLSPSGKTAIARARPLPMILSNNQSGAEPVRFKFVDFKNKIARDSVLVDSTSQTVSWSPASNAVLLRYDAPQLLGHTLRKDGITGFQHPAYTILLASSGKALSVRAADAQYIAAGFWTRDSKSVALLVYRTDQGIRAMKHPTLYRMPAVPDAGTVGAGAVVSVDKLHRMSSSEVAQSVSPYLEATLAARLAPFNEEYYLQWAISELDSGSGTIAISRDKRKVCLAFKIGDEDGGVMYLGEGSSVVRRTLPPLRGLGRIYWSSDEQRLFFLSTDSFVHDMFNWTWLEPHDGTIYQFSLGRDPYPIQVLP